jgi:hypothetical protein
LYDHAFSFFAEDHPSLRPNWFDTV